MTSQALKVGLIGAGGISRKHLEAYQLFPEQLQLMAVCDVREEAAQTRAREMQVEAIYTDPRKMLEEADIEAVDICTIHDQHAELAIMAAKAKKHILVEKPMACSLDECRAMIAAAQENGVILMVAQNQRYETSFQGVRRLIDDGVLGTVRAVRFDCMQNMAMFAKPGQWLYDGKRAGGGIVISAAVHRLDLLRYFLGEVKSVSAVCRTANPDFINGAEDYACATLEFENGVIGEMFASYSSFRMPWSESFMIFGDRGAIHAVPAIGHDYGPAFIASSATGQENTGWEEQFRGFVPIEPGEGNQSRDSGYTNEQLHFAACCRSGQEPLSSGRDNIQTMKIVFGIYESARRGGESVQLATL